MCQARRPNQQCQSTEENQLVVAIRLESHQNHSTMLQQYNSRQSFIQSISIIHVSYGRKIMKTKWHVFLVHSVDYSNRSQVL